MRLTTVGIVLTLSDSTLTYLWLQLGIAYEGNPVLRVLMDTHGVGFTLALRAAVGTALLVALYALREHSALARPATVLAVIVLGLVNIWHLYGASQFLPL